MGESEQLSEIKYAEIDSLRVRYEESGVGSPLIIMHGWGCSLETVRTIARAASKWRKVINVDMPGFGQSEEPSSIWGVEEYTSFLENFVTQLKLENVTIIGHSFGGRVGILYASRNKVDKLVLVDSAGIKPKRSLKYYFSVYSFKILKNTAKILLPKKKADRIIAHLRNKKGSADYKSSSPMMKSIMSKVVNEDLKSVMPLIKAPTLLIWGRQDTATPVKDAETMKSLIKDSGLVVFENAGHYSFLDNPYGFKKVLDSFLSH